jgi:hypothetical protein
VACPFKFFVNGLKNFVVGDCVANTEVVVYRSFLTNVEMLYDIEVQAFCLKL